MNFNAADCIKWLLENFGLVMFVLATLLIIINKRLVKRNISNAEIVYRWIALLPLGITALYAALLHIFFPSIASQNIGWMTSPFQTEVGVANLAIGMLGILSFQASYGFRLATVVAATIWLGGDGIFHIDQIIRMHNLANGNAGTWLWLDIMVPVVLIICIIKLRNDNKPYRFR